MPQFLSPAHPLRCRLVAALCSCLAFAACSEQGVDQALGTLERDRIILRATANEIITEQPLQEGHPVSEGDLLVQLDPRNQQARVAAARAEANRASAHLTELRNGALEFSERFSWTATADRLLEL